MIRVADDLYSRILEGFALLVQNPVECAAVGLVQSFSFLFVCALVLHLLIEVAATWNLWSRSASWNDERLGRVFGRAISASPLQDVPSLMVPPPGSPQVFTAGYIRPAVFISHELADALDDEELEAVFRHELAHVERRDNIAVTLLRAGSSLALWLVPVVLVLSFFFARDELHFGSLRAKLLALAVISLILVVRRYVWRPLGALREISCDDHAVRSGADPLVLAAAIVKTWKLQRLGPVWRVTATANLLPLIGPLVERRVARLLSMRDPVRERPNWLTRAIVCVGIATLLFVASYHVRSATSEKPPLRWSQISPP